VNGDHDDIVEGFVIMTDRFDRLKPALADRYTIEREIGAGGMGSQIFADGCR
jgi:hypothetical protein